MRSADADVAEDNDAGTGGRDAVFGVDVRVLTLNASFSLGVRVAWWKSALT